MPRPSIPNAEQVIFCDVRQLLSQVLAEYDRVATRCHTLTEAFEKRLPLFDGPQTCAPDHRMCTVLGTPTRPPRGMGSPARPARGASKSSIADHSHRTLHATASNEVKRIVAQAEESFKVNQDRRLGRVRDPAEPQLIGKAIKDEASPHCTRQATDPSTECRVVHVQEPLSPSVSSESIDSQMTVEEGFHTSNGFSDVPMNYRESIKTAVRAFKEMSSAALPRSPSSATLGWYQKVKQDTLLTSAIVETVTAIVIFANAVTIGLSSDIARHSMVWLYLDFCFLLFYIFERIAKFLAQGCRKYFFGPDKRWNIFEGVLVVFGVLELAFDLQSRYLGGGDVDGSTMPLFRMARLFRIVKVIRLFRLQIFSDLLVMVDGLRYGAKTLMWSALLICIPLYVVALVFRETVGTDAESGSAAENFSTLPLSFFTMFRCIVASDCAESEGKPVFVLVSDQAGWVYGVMYLCFVLFMTFGLFNVIIAVYVENTMHKVKDNEMSLKRMRLEDDDLLVQKTSELINVVWEAAKERCEDYGVECDHADFMKFEITHEFFADLCKTPGFRNVLRGLDVNDGDQLDLFATLDVDGSGTLSLEELMMGIIKLRGDPRRADIISVGLVARNLQAMIRKLEEKLQDNPGVVRRENSSATAKDSGELVRRSDRKKTY